MMSAAVSGHYTAVSVDRKALQTALGPRLVGAVDMNGVGMLATLGVARRQDVGQSASGRRLRPRLVGSLDANGVGMPATAWFD